MQRRKLLILGVIGIVLVATDIGYGGTYVAYKVCVNNCYATTNPWTKKRADCIELCNSGYLAAATAEAEAFNVVITSLAKTNQGYGTIEHLRLVGNPTDPVTITVNVTGAVAGTTIAAYLTFDANPGVGGDPEATGGAGGSFALPFVGRSGDDFNFTITPGDYDTGKGLYSGYLLVRDTSLTDGQLDTTKNARAIYLHAAGKGIPTVSGWGFAVMSLMVLVAATYVIRRRGLTMRNAMGDVL